MDFGQPTHQFADARASQIDGRKSDYTLTVRQQPMHGRVAVGKDKERKPLDPPPIIQLQISHNLDPTQNFLHSPYIFMTCNLIGEHDERAPSGCVGPPLSGTLVSSLHRLKDTENKNGAFFIFTDLSVKIEGNFRLKFTLFELRNGYCFYRNGVTSQAFTVHSPKNFPGMAESTSLTRTFSDQGVRVRLRKAPRTLLRKRGPAMDDYEPRHYSAKKPREPELSLPQGQPQSQPHLNQPLENNIYPNHAYNAYSQHQQQSGPQSYHQHAQLDNHWMAHGHEYNEEPARGSDGTFWALNNGARSMEFHNQVQLPFMGTAMIYTLPGNIQCRWEFCDMTSKKAKNANFGVYVPSEETVGRGAHFPAWEYTSQGELECWLPANMNQPSTAKSVFRKLLSRHQFFPSSEMLWETTRWLQVQCVPWEQRRLKCQ